jgi:hypothetical protein
MLTVAKFSPVIVTELPPLIATLKSTKYEAVGASNEKAALLVPRRAAIVTPATLDAAPPMLARHETVEADDHDVVKQESSLLSIVRLGEKP